MSAEVGGEGGGRNARRVGGWMEKTEPEVSGAQRRRRRVEKKGLKGFQEPREMLVSCAVE